MWWSFLGVILCVGGSYGGPTSNVCKDPVCEYSFVIDQYQSMIWAENVMTTDQPVRHRLFFDDNEKLYFEEYDRLDPHNIPPIIHYTPEEEWERHSVLPLDGVFKSILAVNGQMPGPIIEVMQGAEVIVNVTNMIMGVDSSIHWHGIHHHGRPWMDGIPGITQCAIHAPETFQYRFTADPPGTHWWHSHSALQTSDGIAGMLVVHEQAPLHADLYDEDVHRVIVQDWYHAYSDEIMLTVDSGFWFDPKHQPSYQGYPDENDQWLWIHPLPYEQRSAGGAILSGNPYESGLINGRGRFSDDTPVPYTRFKVEQNSRHRMRFLNTGMSFPLRISIDSHTLKFVSFSGFDVEPVEAGSFMLFPAERADVVITCDQPAGEYWVRAQTIETNTSYVNQILAVLEYEPSSSGHAKAAADNEDLLSFSFGDEYQPAEAPVEEFVEPTVSSFVTLQSEAVVEDTCSADTPCVIVNCPFDYDPYDYWVTCHNPASFKLAKRVADAPKPPATPFELDVRDRQVPQDVDLTLFLNWRDPRQVNRQRYIQSPGVILFDGVPESFQCPEDKSLCDRATCVCTNMIEVNYGDAVELVLINQKSQGIQSANAVHPIHLHGYTFWVVGDSYGVWDRVQQKFLVSEGVRCNTGTCNSAQWQAGYEPDRNLVDPPRMDTVTVSPGQFVVVRFYADNPGVWHLHCHLELHGMVGMGVALKVNPPSSDPNDPLNWMSQVPVDFPTCGNFMPSDDNGGSKLTDDSTHRKSSQSVSTSGGSPGAVEFSASAVFALSAIMFALGCAISLGLAKCFASRRWFIFERLRGGNSAELSPLNPVEAEDPEYPTATLSVR